MVCRISKVKIGTRSSPLALAQAYLTRRKILETNPELNDDALEIVIVKTSADKILAQPLTSLGGKGLFTKEIDDALLDGRIDIAVHSMKDVPTSLPPGVKVPAVMIREDVRDVFISSKAKSLVELPPGSVIGTSSLRRQAQILNKYPQLEVINFRGNVQSRVRKLQEGKCDATLLAIAGIKRLEMTECITEIIPIDELVPAVSQGAIGIACRENDREILKVLESINHEDTRVAVVCERAFLSSLGGNCRTPVAGLCQFKERVMHFRGLVATADGKKIEFVDRFGGCTESDALDMGKGAGDELRERCGSEFFSWLN